jgi:hypothetical protein
MEIQVKLTPPVKPGQVIVYHAWEPFQFKGGDSYQGLLPSPLNPIALAGGYFHLQPMVMMGTPECTDRGTRVDVHKVQAAGDLVANGGGARGKGIAGQIGGA